MERGSEGGGGEGERVGSQQRERGIGERGRGKEAGREGGGVEKRELGGFGE